MPAREAASFQRAGLDKIERDGNLATNSIAHECDVKRNSTMEN